MESRNPNKPFHVRIDAELYGELRAIADADDRTIAKAVNRLLRKAIQDIVDGK
jgi:hypothetical protein